MAMSMVSITHATLNNWTGLYAGVSGDVVFNDAQLKSQQLGFTNVSETCNACSDFSSLSPGIQLGYLYQFQNKLVSGIEANVTVNTRQTDSLICSSDIDPNVYDSFSFRNQMQSSIKARLGRELNWHTNTLLPYLTAGASFAKVGLTYRNEGGDYYSDNATKAGWLLGAGVEWAFMQHWSMRAEYFYADYGRAINLRIPSVYGLDDSNGGARVDLSSNNFVVAVNYWI